MDAILAFELANRAYFARFIDDRGDDFYERYAERHRELLTEQDGGECIFYVLTTCRRKRRSQLTLKCW